MRLAYRLPAPPSDRGWQGAQSRQGSTEQVPPGPALREMQSETARRACKSSDQGEEAPSEGPGGHHLLPQTDAGGPAGQIVSHHLHGQPSGVGGKAPRGQMVQSHTVLQVADGVLDLGVSAMVGFQFQGVPVPVGDEAVIAVAGEQRQLRAGRGPDPSDYEAHRRGVRLTPEGRVSGLGHVGSAFHPVGDGCPVRLGYGLDEIAQALVLADGDGVADIPVAAGGQHGVGVEAAVGSHRELSGGPSVAYPSHRFTQEVGGAPSSVGAARTQPSHQHVAGSRGNGQQRVIAPLAGVAVVARALLGRTVGFTDGGVQVDGQRPVAGSGSSGPGPGQQLPAHPIQLANMTPTEAAQEGPQRGGRLDHAAQHPRGPASTQHVGIVNAVATGQSGCHQRHHLVACVGSAWGTAQVKVPINQLGQAQMPSQCGRKDQPSIADQAVVVEGDLDAVGVVIWYHLLGAPCFWLDFSLENHYPRSKGALSYTFNPPRHSSLRWIGVNMNTCRIWVLAE